MVTEETRVLLEKAVVIAVAIAYQGPEELREVVEAATLAEALERWEELAFSPPEGIPSSASLSTGRDL